MSSDNLYPFETKMDLPAPRPAQEVPNNPDQQPVLQQGSEVNPEFLPKVAQDNPNPGAQAQAASQAQMAAGAAATPVAPQQTTAAPAHALTNPDLAEDVDLIEKEWVEKAKAIVSHTKEDPRRQNTELNRMKADYIKKRYNKDIQVGE